MRSHSTPSSASLEFATASSTGQQMSRPAGPQESKDTEAEEAAPEPCLRPTMGGSGMLTSAVATRRCRHWLRWRQTVPSWHRAWMEECCSIYPH